MPSAVAGNQFDFGIDQQLWRLLFIDRKPRYVSLLHSLAVGYVANIRKTVLSKFRMEGDAEQPFFKEGTEPTRYATHSSDGNQVYGGDGSPTDGPVSTDDIF